MKTKITVEVPTTYPEGKALKLIYDPASGDIACVLPFSWRDMRISLVDLQRGLEAFGAVESPEATEAT